MDFDSPDVEKDFPGLYASESGTSKKKEESDFSEGDHEKLSKKELLIGRRKDKKDKKDRGYATLEGESSPEEEIETKSPSKSAKKSKAFKFSSSKSKEKREKSREKDKLDKEIKEKDKDVHYNIHHEVREKERKKEKEKKEKEKKEKSKEKDKKDKKSKQSSVSEEVLELGDVQPVFGVSVSLATERSRCHDGIDLPLVVRDCIDYLQQNALHNEHIYKVEPVKTRLQYFKKLYNNRESQGTDELDTPTACGLLKLFLKELPEPVLTTDLIAKFEEAASHPDVTQQEQELCSLLEQLPSCNKTLLSWILLHFDCVIQNEKTNKMNAQCLAMLLSSTLQMSHRLLVALLCHCSNLFPGVQLIRYIPPITSASPKLPETRDAIQIELRKQESLLAQIHAEMNAGFVSKKREEQLWEVQRIITQLKRKLRTFDKKVDSMQKSIEDTIDTEGATATTINEIQAINNSSISNNINSANQNHKTKSSCSDDESVKTLTALSTESASETKNTPQETPDIPKMVPEENEIPDDDDDADDDNGDVDNSKDNDNDEQLWIDDFNKNNPADRMYIHETDILMLPETHPEYYTLVRLQLENQELLKWKSQLQARINSERAEVLRLKKLLNLAEQQQQQQQGKKINVPNLNTAGGGDTEGGDYERIVEHYLKENVLLEQKKNLLAKELFEENKDLIQLQVELNLQAFKVGITQK